MPSVDFCCGCFYNEEKGGEDCGKVLKKVDHGVVQRAFWVAFALDLEWIVLAAFSRRKGRLFSCWGEDAQQGTASIYAGKRDLHFQVFSTAAPGKTALPEHSALLPRCPGDRCR